MAHHSEGIVRSDPKSTIYEENVIDQVYLNPCLYDTYAQGYKDQATRTKAWDNIGSHLNTKGEQVKDTWEKLRRGFMNAIKRRRSKQMHPWRFEQRMSFLYNHIDPSKITTKYDTDEQQYYSESDDKSFIEELEISDPKVCDRLTHEESSDGSYGPEQNQNRPVASSADTNNLHHEQSRLISKDPPEIPERGTQRKKRNFDKLCDESWEAVEIWRKRGTTASGRTGNEDSISERDDTDLFFLSMAKTVKTLTPIEQARIKLQVSQFVLNAQIASLEQASQQRR